MVGDFTAQPGSITQIGGQQQVGDVVQGDKVLGDKVAGGKYDVHIQDSSGIAIGDGASVHQGLTGEQVAALFASVYRQIERRPADAQVDKDELRQAVERIQRETAKGERANQDRLDRWLSTLADLAPDVVEVLVNSLLNPGAGAASAVKSILSRFRR